MRRCKAEDQKEQEGQITKQGIFQQKLELSLRSVTRLLLFVQFTVNYGYAIENAWVTMLMITMGTSNQVDSFVWITPIIIAVLIRPYLVRYVHNIKYKVYRELSLVTFFLFLGALGCFIVAMSCGISGKKRMVRRIFTCTLGWTLMDISFEFCQFFADKIQQNQKTLRENKGEKEEIGHFGRKQNCSFYGLFLGYVVSMFICWFVDGHSLKDYYQCCKYAYWTVGGLTGVIGVRLYVENYMSMPKRQIEEKDQSFSLLPLSTHASLYLPGMTQLWRSDRHTYLLLLLHASVVFLNDVVTIYATMWFSEPADIEFGRRGEALLAGLQFGSLALLGYTILDNLKINGRVMNAISFFRVSILIVLLLCIVAFYRYDYTTFSCVCLSVALLNQFYRHSIYNSEIQNNHLFERCIEIIQRAQKIFVLAVMPPIIMLLLGRDDISDCLLWGAGVASVALILYSLSQKIDIEGENQLRTQRQTVKVTKIE